MAKRMAGQMPAFAYDADRFFRIDEAADEIAAGRAAGFDRLGQLYAERFPKTLALTRQTREGLSDLQFTGSYRVPFPFSAGCAKPWAQARSSSAPTGRS